MGRHVNAQSQADSDYVKAVYKYDVHRVYLLL